MASRVGSRGISCSTGHPYLSSTPNARNIDGAIDESFPRTDPHPNTMLVHPTGTVIETYTGCMLLVTPVYKEPMVLPFGRLLCQILSVQNHPTLTVYPKVLLSEASWGNTTSFMLTFSMARISLTAMSSSMERILVKPGMPRVLSPSTGTGAF